jgi:hypothetical protein
MLRPGDGSSRGRIIQATDRLGDVSSGDASYGDGTCRNASSGYRQYFAYRDSLTRFAHMFFGTIRYVLSSYTLWSRSFAFSILFSCRISRFSHLNVVSLPVPVRGSKARYFSIRFTYKINESSVNTGLGVFPSSKFSRQTSICMSVVVGSPYGLHWLHGYIVLVTL